MPPCVVLNTSRYIFAVLNHHWSKRDKATPVFVARYPYAASIREMLKYFVRMHDLAFHCIIMDNYFSNVETFRELRTEFNVDCVGTLKNPTGGAPAALLWTKDHAGTFGDTRHIATLCGVVGVQQWLGTSYYAFLRFNALCVAGCVSWRACWVVTLPVLSPAHPCADRRVVTVATTMHTVHSGTAAKNAARPGAVMVTRKRKTTANGAAPFVTSTAAQPPALQFYSEHMGGVDLADQMAAAYNVQRPSKRWYMCVFYRMLEVALTNSFVAYKTACKEPLTEQLAFRVLLIDLLLIDNGLGHLASAAAREMARAGEGSGAVPAAGGPGRGPRGPALHLPEVTGARGVCGFSGCATSVHSINDSRLERSRPSMHCADCNAYFCCSSTKSCYKLHHLALHRKTASLGV